MIRFIHAADIHLDSLMKGIRSESAGIDPAAFRLSTRQALKNLVDWAIREKVDFVTLGGDNFDGDWKSFETGLFFVREMTRLHEAGIPVVSIRGNHDARNRMTRDLPLPPSFRMLGTDKPESFEVMDGVTVTGQSFAREAETGNLVAAYPANDSSSAISIGLLHTSLAGGTRDGHDNYAPCDVSDLQRKRYHFWGLGHIHQAGWMQSAADVPVLYPGNLQGRHPRETGEKGAWAITLSDDGSLIEHRFQPLDTSRWEAVTIDISGAVNVEDCWELVRTALSPQVAAVGGRPMAARIRFAGRSKCHVPLRLLIERDNAILSLCQNEANLAFPNKVWIESVELRSRAPVATQAPSEAMQVLSGFIANVSNSESWIAECLESQELSKLRKQIDLFESAEERAELARLFESDSIRELMAEIPDILEARLNDIASPSEGA